MKLTNARWRRLLAWALRVPSPSKAFVVASMRKPILERRLLVDDAGDIVGIEPIDWSADDGLLTLREAWTGEFG